ncbi:hypothetical protein HMPREF1603_01551 [Escherichia coli 907892]|nr:hypothetical protein HMPREF1603_01551 [Escherichia coli 907892]
MMRIIGVASGNSAQPPDTSKSLIRLTSRIRLEEMQLHMRRD